MTREAQFEGIQHGSVEFPFAWYHIRIPEYFLTYPVHWHDEIEIVYCIRGTFENTVGTKVITLNPGDFVIIPPQEIHSNRVIAGHEAEFITILFDLRFIKVGKFSSSLGVFAGGMMGINAGQYNISSILGGRIRFDYYLNSHLSLGLQTRFTASYLPANDPLYKSMTYLIDPLTLSLDVRF